MRNKGRAGLGLVGLAAWAAGGAASAAEDLMGQPTPGAIDLQPAASILKHDAINFHNLLLWIIGGILALVLGLLIWIVVRYNRRANPVPARWSHNTAVEVAWTLVPVLILACIAIPSLHLLFKYHNTPPADVTVKVTGNQWYWTYEYPDLGVGQIISTLQPEAEAKARGAPYLLAASTPMVVPVGKVVRVQVTAADVLHAFALPAFGLKTDAIPGRLNETWFRAERMGTFYGQCSELCGKDHAYMPIEIKVVGQTEWAAWVAQNGAPPAPPAAPAPAAPPEGAAPAPAAAAPAAATPAAAAPAAPAAK